MVAASNDESAPTPSSLAQVSIVVLQLRRRRRWVLWSLSDLLQCVNGFRLLRSGGLKGESVTYFCLFAWEAACIGRLRGGVARLRRKESGIGERSWVAGTCRAVEDVADLC